MYLEHFGLNAWPFGLAPDSGSLFLSRAHARAKAYMESAVWNDEGFVVITGDIGCGKTILVQKLVSELGENVVVAKVFQTQLDEVELLQAILVEFGLKPFNSRKIELLDMLNGFLIEQFVQRKRVVLVVDDAHNLGVRALEEIRLIAGLETRGEKILHVILVGLPRLDEILERPELEQLAQCVKLRHHLEALDEQEHDEYIRHRLSIVSTRERTLFLPETLPVLFRYTGGVPRLINILCNTALTCAYADDLEQVSPEVVETAASELQWPVYAERAYMRRAKTMPGALEGKVGAITREQLQVSTRATGDPVGKPERESASIQPPVRKELAAIETPLGERGRKRAQEPGGRRRNRGRAVEKEAAGKEPTDKEAAGKEPTDKEPTETEPREISRPAD